MSFRTSVLSIAVLLPLVPAAGAAELVVEPYVFEAGTQGDERTAISYFAMEYIPHAKSIDEYAREKKLEKHERLDLFVQARCPELDAVLDRAGILVWFADYVDQAGTIPDASRVPRPALNQPYPATP